MLKESVSHETDAVFKDTIRLIKVVLEIKVQPELLFVLEDDLVEGPMFLTNQKLIEFDVIVEMIVDSGRSVGVTLLSDDAVGSPFVLVEKSLLPFALVEVKVVCRRHGFFFSHENFFFEFFSSFSPKIMEQRKNIFFFFFFSFFSRNKNHSI